MDSYVIANNYEKEIIFQEYYSKIKNYVYKCYHRFKSIDSDDINSLSYECMHKSLINFNENRNIKFSTYFINNFNNMLKNELTKKYRKIDYVYNEIETLTYSNSFNYIDYKIDLINFIKTLENDKQKRVLIALVNEEDLKDISKELDLSLVSVYKIKKILIEKLKNYFIK